MNGFRRSLSGEVHNLRDIVEKVLKEDLYDEEDLANTMNDVICSVNALNCIYNKDDEDFTEMADVSVPLIHVEEDD